MDEADRQRLDHLQATIVTSLQATIEDLARYWECSLAEASKRAFDLLTGPVAGRS